MYNYSSSKRFSLDTALEEIFEKLWDLSGILLRKLRFGRCFWFLLYLHLRQRFYKRALSNRWMKFNQRVLCHIFGSNDQIETRKWELSSNFGNSIRNDTNLVNLARNGPRVPNSSELSTLILMRLCFELKIYRRITRFKCLILLILLQTPLRLLRCELSHKLWVFSVNWWSRKFFTNDQTQNIEPTWCKKSFWCLEESLMFQALQQEVLRWTYTLSIERFLLFCKFLAGFCDILV